MRGVETIQNGGNRERAARFTDLYARGSPRVAAFLYRRTGDRGTSEELTSDVFRIAWEHTADGGRVTPGWLFVTARNVLRNHWRSESRLRELHRRITDELDRAPADERDTAVLDTLDRLPSHHREVLILSYWDGLGAAEAGAVLGCGAPAVWVRLHRARKAFRELFPTATDPTGEQA